MVEKCLHILPMNKLSGAEKMALLLCKNIDEYEPIVVCGGDVLKEVFEKNNIKAYSINFSMKKLFTTLKSLKKIIQQHNISIIHAHDNNASLSAYLLKSLFRINIKVVSHIHSCYPWLKVDGINKKIDSFLRTRYDHNILCGKIVCDFYKENAKYFPSDKSSTLSNAIDIDEINKRSSLSSDEIRNKYNIPKDKKIIGFVGRLCEIKGLVPFINEFEKHKHDFTDAKILLVGSGEQEEEIKTLIHELELEEYFVLVGFQEDVYQFYPVIDIFFLASLYEGLPMVLLEAMAFEKPSVSMNVGGISEVIKDGHSGYLIEEKNYKDLIMKIRILKDNEKLRRQFGKNAFEDIKNFFDINEYCRKIEKIYNRLTK